ncbi:Sb-PDE family phosphodiesterase [Parabacteroides distasonis]|uniref:Sb-PDE family phosphodiesterase n=1 Tax=Parabacteroides distasonis TaxID=823 RepID=UPI003F245B01
MRTRNIWVAISLIMAGFYVQAQECTLPKQIKVGKERIKARKEIRLPEIDGYHLLKCDFHIHTMFSDGIVWPTLRVQEAWEEGLDAIAITEHIEGQPARPHIGKGHNNSFDIAKEEADRRNIILVKGGEITRSMPPGHLNALFLKDVNALDQKDYMKAIEEAHNQGAFIQWNHPGWGVDSIQWHDVHETLFQKGWLNGIEVFNEFEWYPVALDWVNNKNLTLLCNTDVHDVIERLYDFNMTSHRPMTLVLSKERTEEGLKEALFARRTLIYFYDTLMGKEDLLDKFYKASIQIHPVHYTTEERRYVEIENTSDVPFRLHKTDKSATGFPDKIEIPAGKTILVILPKSDKSGIDYEVGNLIITSDKRLAVKLF